MSDDVWPNVYSPQQCKIHCCNEVSITNTSENITVLFRFIKLEIRERNKPLTPSIISLENSTKIGRFSKLSKSLKFAS